MGERQHSFAPFLAAARNKLVKQLPQFFNAPQQRVLLSLFQANRVSSTTYTTCYGQVYGRKMLLLHAVSVLSFGRACLLLAHHVFQCHEPTVLRRWRH